MCMLMSILAEIRSEDAVYVLAYSVIMLNTDLHNPQVRVGCAIYDVMLQLAHYISETNDH